MWNHFELKHEEVCCEVCMSKYVKYEQCETVYKYIKYDPHDVRCKQGDVTSNPG